MRKCALQRCTEYFCFQMYTVQLYDNLITASNIQTDCTIQFHKKNVLTLSVFARLALLH